MTTDSTNFQILTSDFEQAFPTEYRYARVDAITQDGKDFKIDPKYKDDGDLAALRDFLGKVTSAAPEPLSKDLLTALKKNLTVLSDTWSDVFNAQQRRDALQVVQGKVTAQYTSNTGVLVIKGEKIGALYTFLDPPKK